VRPTRSSSYLLVKQTKATLHFGDSLVVLSPRWDSLVLLNPTAKSIWDDLQKGQSQENAVANLASYFSIPKEEAQAAAEPVIRLWNSKDLISSVPETQATRLSPNPLSLEQDRQPAFRHDYDLTKVPFSILFQSAEIEAILGSVLGHLEVNSNASPDHIFEVQVTQTGYMLIKDGIEIARETQPHSIRHALVYEIARISYPDAKWLVFTHAGAVSDGTRCILMPGLPGCGKSTLTTALVLEGLCYVSEDIVPISRKPWSVAPVPIRICLREGGYLALEREYPEIQTVCGGSRYGQQLRYFTPPVIRERFPSHLPVHALVFPEFVQGHKAQLKPISHEDKLARLIQTGAWFGDSLNAGTIEELLDWIQSIPGYEICYGDLKGAIHIIRDLLCQ
jgi:hypothetical protein